MWYWCPNFLGTTPGEHDWEWAYPDFDDPAIAITMIVEECNHRGFQATKTEYFDYTGNLNEQDEDYGDTLCQDCNSTPRFLSQNDWFSEAATALVDLGWVRCGHGQCNQHLFESQEARDAHIESAHAGDRPIEGDRGAPMFNDDLFPLPIPTATTHEAW